MTISSVAWAQYTNVTASPQQVPRLRRALRGKNYVKTYTDRVRD